MYRNARDMPIKWPDQQGGDIVTVISSEFIIPVDPMSDREGIYHSGWAYRRDNIWNTGSVITIYGVKDIDLQNRIIDRIKDIVAIKNYWDVQVTFYDDSRYEKEGNVTRRLDVPELRSERIIGKTEFWRSEVEQ